MQFDDLFEYFGNIGPFQICVFIILVLPMFLQGISTTPFRIAYVDHWCQIPSLVDLSPEQQKYIAIPMNTGGEYDSCTMYGLNFSSYSTDELDNWNRTLVYGTDSDIPIINCESWMYDRSQFEETTMTAFDLVCGRTHLNYLPLSLSSVATLISAPIMGVVSDRIGRKKMFYFASFLSCAVGSLMAAFAREYWLYTLGLFIGGIGGGGVYIGGFLIVMELIGPLYRGPVGMIYTMCYSIGIATSSIWAYYLRNYRYLLLLNMMGLIPFAFIWFIPEPPRWLIQNNYMDEANSVFSRMARMNNKTVPDNIHKMMIDIKKEEENKAALIKKKNITHLFASRKMTLRMCVLYLNWFTNSLIYYTFALHIQTLVGSMYINNAIMGLIEIPALLIGTVLMNWRRLGRRYTVAFAMFFAGVSCLVIVPLLLNDIGVGTQMMSFLGKGLVATSFGGMYVCTAEVTPTHLRQIAIGSSASFSNMGGILAPYMGIPMASIWLPLPNVINGLVGVLAGLVLLYIPETLGKPMCQTIEEAEALDRTKAKKNPNQTAQSNNQQLSEKKHCNENEVFTSANNYSHTFDSTWL